MYRKIYHYAVRRQRAQYEMMEHDPELVLGPGLPEQETVEVLIPSTACLWVMLAYLSLGTVMFAEWEQWDYLDSAYFCVTSLLKVKMLKTFYCIFPVFFCKYLVFIHFFSFIYIV